MNPPGHVVVTGLMGSGKTTLGRALAAELDRRFVDSDEQLQAAVGRTAREIAEEEGIDALHALEARLLREALAAPQPAVIAAAASTVEDAASREALATPDVAVIWLRGSVATLASRVGSSSHRPLVADDPRAVLETQIATRGPLLEAVADAIVDVDGRSADVVLGAARAFLAGGGLGRSVPRSGSA